MLTKAFFEAVAPLARPRMGTETMAPLLYQLIRFTRPRSVLEVGMGYTTPFVCKALADNYVDECRSSIALAAKASELPPAITSNGANFDRRAFAKLAKSERLKWLEAEPCLADPAFYANCNKPRLFAIDDLSSGYSSAQGLLKLLSDLELQGYVEVTDGEFRGKADVIRRKHGVIDFMWFDCGGHEEYTDFLQEFWPLLNPSGGLLLMHYTLTNLSMGSVIKDFKLSQLQIPGNAELVSLLEPHKMMQNSVSIIRKTSAYTEKIFYEVKDLSLEKD